MDGNTWAGIQCLLDDYAGVRSDDIVLLLYTTDSAEPAAWITAALELRGIRIRRVWMNPLRDSGFEQRLAEAMPSPGDFDGRLVVLSFERDTLSHNIVLKTALLPFEKSRVAVFRAINASESLFSKALRATPQELSARNTALLERCMAATRLRIRSQGGTDLRITLDNKTYRWISNRGSARSGGTVVLPAGEIASFPAKVEGVLVADFAFNVNIITDRDARLRENPVTVWIEDRRAVRWACDDAGTMSFLDECFGKYCTRNIGELGLGTNPGIGTGIAMNSHINERRPGVHLGFGQHNQDPGIVGYECNLHLDLISRGAMVWFDDDPVPVDLENLVPSQNPHPRSPRDEDAFEPLNGSTDDDLAEADCCGLLTCDGIMMADTQEKLAELL